MTLSNREKTIAIISNGIAVFSLLQEQNKLNNTSMYDFVLKMTPQSIRAELSAKLIDEVFQYVSAAHSS